MLQNQNRAHNNTYPRKMPQTLFCIDPRSAVQCSAATNSRTEQKLFPDSHTRPVPFLSFFVLLFSLVSLSGEARRREHLFSA